MKYCYKCGKELNDNAIYCSSCGTKQDDNACNQAAQEPTITVRAKRNVFDTLAIIAMVIAISTFSIVL